MKNLARLRPPRPRRVLVLLARIPLPAKGLRGTTHTVEEIVETLDDRWQPETSWPSSSEEVTQ